MKLLRKYLGKKLFQFSITLFLAYLILGCALPFLYHKSVNEDMKTSFKPQSFYSDNQGTERVLCIDDNYEALLWRLKIIESAQNEINLRMHDKYLIADDSVYILGGRNINDLSLGNYTDKTNTDRDVLVYEAIGGD